MKILAIILCVLANAMFLPSSSQGQSTTPRQPKFKIEIRVTNEKEKKGPGYAVTNLTSKTVTACVFELSYSSPSARKSKSVWDALLEGVSPIEPGQTIFRPLLLIGANALPGKVEVISGLWADGESFGQPELANNILKNRVLHASQYDDAAAILQQGLSQNWTRERYQQAFSDKPDTGPVYTVRTALTATQQTGQTPQEFTHTMQFLLQTFRRQADKLRKGKPNTGNSGPGSS